MSTADDARMAEIRAVINRICTKDEESGDVAYVGMNGGFLLAEVDRLTREVAAVTEERDRARKLRDYNGPYKNIPEFVEHLRLNRDHWREWPDDNIDEMFRAVDHFKRNMDEYVTKYCALRAAHTWTVATPASVPPVGSGPWLVEWKQRDGYALYGRMRPSCDVWLDNAMQTDICKIDGTRFAAWPAEPSKEATPDA